MVAAHQTTFVPVVAGPDAISQARRVAASVIGLSKQFGNASVLKDINFDIAEGETLVLLGASGSGKTTILRIIAGLEQPDTGRVVLHGKDVTELPARERGVGVIFQSYALFPKMTVEQNIGYGLRIRRRSRKEIRTTVDRLLELVRLKEHRHKYPSQLSGGQQQRVAIARTLAYQPEVLLFDEPFGALDAQTRSHLRSEIRALLRKVRVPAIFITHDQEEAMELGDRIAVIHAGHIEQIGTPQEIYDHSATEYVATFLGRANVFRGLVRHGHVMVCQTLLPLPEGSKNLRDGQAVSVVFRPEDVRLSSNVLHSRGCDDFAAGVITEVSFAGAFERLSVQLEDNSEGFSPSLECGGLAPLWPSITTSITKRRQAAALQGGARYIHAMRLKPEASGPRLRNGDRVRVGLTSFSVLPVKSSGAWSPRLVPLSVAQEFAEGSNSSWN